jgi:hypothetical protein
LAGENEKLRPEPTPAGELRKAELNCFISKAAFYSHSGRFADMPLVISLISTFIRGTSLLLRKAEGRQSIDELLKGGEFESHPSMFAQAALESETTSQLAFTRSLLALSTVCAPNPYGRLASEATTHEPSKFIEPGTAPSEVVRRPS